MKKHTNQKEINKIAKTALAMVLAGTFTFSSSVAFANDTNTENNNESVELQTNATTITTFTNGTDSTTNQETVQAKEEVNKPTLIPGDFFYFAKLTLEKIKLILTTDDIKEAKLFAKFATERLAEAESLFAKGEEEKALETIQKALVDMAKADSVATVDMNAQLPTVVEEGSIEATESTKTTTDSSVIVDVPENDVEAVDEIEKMVSQNIIALTAAMEKVKNPVAKAALQKNIDKSYAKLAKKLAKIEARLVKEAEEAETQVSTDTKETTTVSTDLKTETEIEIEVEKEDESETEVISESKEVEDQTTTTTTVAAPSKKEVKEVEKQARKEVKQVVKKHKEDAKKLIKEAKKVLKDEKHEAKHAEKKEKGKSEKEEKGHK